VNALTRKDGLKISLQPVGLMLQQVLERPSQSKLHYATSLGFAERSLRSREFAKVRGRRGDCRKSKFALKEWINSRN